MQKLLFTGLCVMALFFAACGSGGDGAALEKTTGDGAVVEETTPAESNQFGKATFGNTKFE